MIPRSILAWVCSSVLLLTIGGFLADRLAAKPFRERRAQIAEWKEKIADSRAKLVSIKNAKREVANAAKRSVGPTVSLARMQYQQWLLNSSKQLGIAQAIVIPAAPRKTELGHQLPFRIQACAELDRIAALLTVIHNSAALHRISEISLTPNASGLHRIELSLEALHVAGEKSPGDAILFHAGAAAKQESQLRFTSKDIFVRPEPKQVADSQLPSRPSPTSLQFVATFFKDGRRYAWLLDTRTDKEYEATEHGDLVVDSSRIHVTEIGNDFVAFERNGSVHRIHLGDETHIDPLE